MTRETKAGLLMILVLAGVFGFMVYKKLHQPPEAMAQQDSNQADLNSSSDSAAGPGSEQPVFDNVPAERPRRAIPDPDPVSRSFPDDEPRQRVAMNSGDEGRGRASEREDDPFADVQTPPTRVKPKLPTEIPDDGNNSAGRRLREAVVKEVRKVEAVGREVVKKAASELEEFNPFENAQTANQVATESNELERAQATTEDQRDPFGGDVDAVQDARPNRLAPPDPESARERENREERAEMERSKSSNLEGQDSDSRDPFEVPVSTAKPVESGPERSQVRRDGPMVQMAAAQLGFEAPANGSSGGVLDPATADGFSEPARRPREARDRQQADGDPFGDQPAFQAPSRENVRRTNRPAPPTQIDEDFGPRTNAQPLLAGDSYQIEPNDNFWVISRKKYGTGRYFMALAQHNSKVIPDPQRMKPGVTIATPSARSLEQAYPDLIPKAGPATAVGPIQTASTGSVPVETEAPGGFFMSNDGTPMYRVGKEDTLSDIAQRHLGRSSRWIQVYQMNREILTDGNTLKIGMQLRLPADASRVEVVGTSRTFR